MKKIKTSLFTRLFIYFFILISIPLISFSIVSSTIAKRKIINELKTEVYNIGDSQADKVHQIIEDYRHKTYQLSKTDQIIELLENPELTENKAYMNETYNQLFSTMKGDTYYASASIINTTGTVRISTHPFPEEYDIRNHSTVLDFAAPLMDSKPYTYTKIILNNNEEKNPNVAITLIRYIFDSNDNALGYVIVDIYKNTIKEVIDENTLTTSLLVDTDTFIASELDNASEYYSFSNYPGLNIRDKGEFSENIFYKNNYVLSLNKIDNTNFYIANYIKDQTFNNNLREILILDTISIFVGLILSLILAFFLGKEITKPIGKLIKAMKRVEDGNLAITIEDNNIYEMQDLNENFNKMVLQLVNLIQKTKESQKRIYEAEREALQSQINPHFLFNTLNTIKSLANINNQEEIYTISIKLGQLLRSSIYNKSANCTLEKSLELVKSYLTIQQIRFKDKLEVSYDIDESLLDVETPKLILQPLVENAIIHGLEPKIGLWFLKISIKKVNNKIKIIIEDNGIGFENKQVMANLSQLENSNHVGVFNVYKRLQLFYNNKASLSFEDVNTGGTRAIILIPLEA